MPHNHPPPEQPHALDEKDKPAELALANALLYQTIPQWFIAFAALTYGTGFLTVVTFLERFGLKDIGTEFFKAKYFYVGTMYLVFPCLIGGTAYFVWDLQTHGHERGDDFHSYVPSLFLVTIMLLVFYVFVLFAPPGFVAARGYVVTLMFLGLFIGVVTIQRMTKALIRKAVSERFANRARWLLVAVFGAFGVWLFSDLFPVFLEMVKDGAWQFWLFVVLYGFIFWSIRQRVEHIQKRRRQVALWGAGLCFGGALYYLSISIFAHTIFPHIPAGKGGGDYSYAANVIIAFRGDSKRGEIPTEILETADPGEIRSRPLKIIEETATSLFVADADDPVAGKPEEWRRRTAKQPTVTEIRRELVTCIRYMN